MYARMFLLAYVMLQLAELWIDVELIAYILDGKPQELKMRTGGNSIRLKALYLGKRIWYFDCFAEVYRKIVLLVAGKKILI